MMKRMGGLMMVVALLVALNGCGDDVKKTTVKQSTQESEPEMVAPGEMVVE